VSTEAPKRHHYQLAIELLDWVWELAKRGLIVGALTVLGTQRADPLMQDVADIAAILLWMWSGLSLSRVLFPGTFGSSGDPMAARPAWKQVVILAVTLGGSAVAFFFAEAYIGRLTGN
jgi:hypothetical protein